MRVIALCCRLPSLYHFFELVPGGHGLSRQDGLLLSGLVSRPINAPVPISQNGLKNEPDAWNRGRCVVSIDSISACQCGPILQRGEPVF